MKEGNVGRIQEQSGALNSTRNLRQGPELTNCHNLGVILAGLDDTVTPERVASLAAPCRRRFRKSGTAQRKVNTNGLTRPDGRAGSEVTTRQNCASEHTAG